MNERIKLLADQAEDYATVEYEKWIPTPDFSGIPHIRKIFNEKFAELIVQECCKEITYASVGNEDPVFAYAYISHLRKTFDVES